MEIIELITLKVKVDVYIIGEELNEYMHFISEVKEGHKNVKGTKQVRGSIRRIRFYKVEIDGMCINKFTNSGMSEVVSEVGELGHRADIGHWWKQGPTFACVCSRPVPWQVAARALPK